MRKTVRLYQRLYAFSKRTGSTATLQRIPSSEEREVGEPVGGRAGHREAGAIGQEPTSGLEPPTCSLRVSLFPTPNTIKMGVLQVFVLYSFRQIFASNLKYRLYC